MKTYKIVRFFMDGGRIDGVEGLVGLTLEEAQEHCQREDTCGLDWFDGYTEE
jgi:hypothetical protein